MLRLEIPQFALRGNLQIHRAARPGAAQFPATAGEGQYPNLETRNPKEIRNPKSELWPSLHPLGWPGWAAGMVDARVADLPDSLAQPRNRWLRFGFRISDFLQISDFAFRICPPRAAINRDAPRRWLGSRRFVAQVSQLAVARVSKPVAGVWPRLVHAARPALLLLRLPLTLLMVNLKTLFYRHWLAPRSADFTLSDLVEAWRKTLL